MPSLPGTVGVSLDVSTGFTALFVGMSAWQEPRRRLLAEGATTRRHVELPCFCLAQGESGTRLVEVQGSPEAVPRRVCSGECHGAGWVRTPGTRPRYTGRAYRRWPCSRPGALRGPLAPWPGHMPNSHKCYINVTRTRIRVEFFIFSANGSSRAHPEHHSDPSEPENEGSNPHAQPTMPPSACRHLHAAARTPPSACRRPGRPHADIRMPPSACGRPHGTRMPPPALPHVDSMQVLFARISCRFHAVSCEMWFRLFRC